MYVQKLRLITFNASFSVARMPLDEYNISCTRCTLYRVSVCLVKYQIVEVTYMQMQGRSKFSRWFNFQDLLMIWNRCYAR